MLAKVVPLYFKEGRDQDFDTQLNLLKELLADYIEFLPEVGFGDPVPDADAILFPQILGEAYRQLEDFRSINVPILIITTEFGTMAMWDWEIIKYLRTEGVDVIAPHNMDQTRNLARALAVKKDLKTSKMLVYQDYPGEGFQPEIFKRFYWWEDECVERMVDKFGFTLVKKSFKEFGAAAKLIPDADADAVIAEKGIPTAGISESQLRSAVSRASMGFEELAAADGDEGGEVMPIKKAREDFERRYLKDVLSRCGGDVDIQLVQPC